MKKILLIGNCYLPIPAVEGGAIETLVDEYLNYSKINKDLYFVVYSPFSKKISNKKNNTYTNCEFRYIDKKGIRYAAYRIFFALKRRIYNKKNYPTAYCETIINDLKKRKELNIYDLVLIENEIESLPTYRKYIKSKIVEHLHNDYLSIETKEAKKIVDSCNEFWCVSKFIAKRIEEISNSNKTKVLYNGIDTKTFSKIISEQEKNVLREQLNINKDDYIILYVGRIMPEKGVLELIQGFNILKSRNKNLKLLIVGDKKNNKRELKKYINKLKQEVSKNSDSIIYYGKADVDTLIKLHSITNIQVIPSMWNEAFGLIAVEGICAKHPLVVTNSGGLVEIVNNDSAIIVNRENIVSELSDAILKISSNKALSKNLVNEANKVIEKFDYKEYNKKFDELIRNITQQGVIS